MKDIKRRIKSVGSTRQITKAMELVSSSKLRKAKMRAEQARPYFNELYKSLCEIASANTDLSTIFTVKREVKHRLFIVIAGDRGLAGGYNSNVLKLAASAHAGDAEKPKIIAIGKKAIEYFDKREYDIVASYAGIAENIKPNLAQDIADIAIEMFRSGEVDDVQIFYTMFVSSITQEAQQMAMLPMETVKLENYGTDNADAMTESLSLLYNRARQASITTEIIDIVSGASAQE